MSLEPCLRWSFLLFLHVPYPFLSLSMSCVFSGQWSLLHPWCPTHGQLSLTALYCYACMGISNKDTCSLLPCSTTMLFFISDCNSPASGLSSLLELIKASLNNVSFCVTTCTQNVLLHFSPSDQNMVYFISKILTDGNNIYPNTSKGWPSLLSLISHS